MPPRKKKKADGAAVGLAATEVGEAARPPEIEELEAAIASDGGRALAAYRDPYGGRWIVLAALPIEKVQATPYQRELSETHVDRLALVIPKVGRFLDPIVAVREGDGYWTPNGMHRLEAMKRLGAKSLVALVVPEHEVAFRILALNTEKAHNLKDKALEVIRMARGLADLGDGGGRPGAGRRDGAVHEGDYAFEFEEPAFLTLGCVTRSGPGSRAAPTCPS
jgi:ParB family chromosome partitioning protein